MRQPCRGTRAVHVLCLYLVVLAPRLARADDSYRAALLQGMAAKEKALDSHQSADWEEALRKVRQADAIRTTAETKYEMAYAEAELGQFDLALDMYQAALALGLVGTAARKANAFVNEREPNVARIDIHGKDGSRVIIRGIERARLPLARPLNVMPGSVQVELITDDDQHVERQLALVAGRLEVITFDSGEAQLAPPVSPTRSANRKVDGPSSTLDGERRETQRAPSFHSTYPPESNTTTAANPWHKAGWWLLGSGTAVGVLGLVFIPTSSKMINDNRQTLLAACDVQTNGPDSCAHSKAGLQQAGQSASDSIATWKGVRTTAWFGLATGVTAAAAGATLLLVTNRPSKQLTDVPQISIDARGAALSYQGSF